MATATVQQLKQAREAIVREHAEAEGRHDVEATIATFHSPRYEVAPFGVSDGAAAVRDLLNGMITGFPDWGIETGEFRHGDDFVFVEVRMTGTHNGPWAGWEPTGKKNGCDRRVHVRIRRGSSDM